jgi:hypothetical protein
MNLLPASDGWQLAGGIAIGVLVAIVLIVLYIIWRKGRPFTEGDVFRASRLSKGNHLFPTQVHITPTNVVHYTPQWFGKYEHSIHMAHISSVGIDTHILFSDLYIETSGGAAPIKCEGHHKHDAVRMKELIEQYQTSYYASGGAKAAVPAPASPSSNQKG